jgi:DDE superfamily endonuclease
MMTVRTGRDGTAEWTLGTLTQEAREAGSSPRRTRIVELCTAPPPGSTVICADELGPVPSRTFPPAPGRPPGGHRIKAPLEYSRGPDKTWAYGGLRVADG